MFSELNNNIKEFLISFFEQKKDSILDPLTCLVRLAILDFKPLGTKISLNNNKIKYNEPNILQGAIRWTNGDAREDLHNLFNPLKKAVLWYDTTNQEIKNIFNYAIKGLQKLQSSYNNNSVISHSIQLYIEYLTKNINGKNQDKSNKESSIKNSDDEEENTISKQLRDLWNSREITILNNILLELEDNRKKNTVGLLDEQDALIRTLETILMRKEEKVSNILFENTTSLN
jgi:hypothetical protein